MKLGLLADIHENNDHLRVALARFRQHGVHQVVLLGDICETGDSLAETVDLLVEAKAVGVWGNHDFGFGRDFAWLERMGHSAKVRQFIAGLLPRLEIAQCLFTHVEPWLDTSDVSNLWYLEGMPDTLEKVARSFDAVPHPVMFVGHFHRWMIATRREILDWQGATPICLDSKERYLVLLGAASHGHFAVFDTDALELTPHTCGR
jgi:predicted phosphodiesterase